MRKTMLATAVLAALAATGCEYRSVLITEPTVVSDSPVRASQPAASNNATSPAGITLNALDANPTNVASPMDRISFSVVAHNANRLPMEYAWTATKGTLSGTRGQTVTWMPLRTDGTIEAGVATVQCLISDGAGATKVAAVNLFIRPDGSAIKADVSAAPAVTQ
ncbi:MAG: hypothetical protein VKP57_07235 [Candidatus Sericytochromatia bacterium]|nr:hypothetical protein [Candidatus Sericytochromatia bacterium]